VHGDNLGKENANYFLFPEKGWAMASAIRTRLEPLEPLPSSDQRGYYMTASFVNPNQIPITQISPTSNRQDVNYRTAGASIGGDSTPNKNQWMVAVEVD